MKQKAINLLFILLVTLGFAACNYKLQGFDHPSAKSWALFFWNMGAFFLVTFLVIAFFQTRQLLIALILVIYFGLAEFLWKIPRSHVLELIGITIILIGYFVYKKNVVKGEKLSTSFIVFSTLSLLIWIIIVSQL